MSQSLAKGRRLARRAAMFQVAAGALAASVAAVFWGGVQAAGALVGAGAAALGTAGMAHLALGGGIQPARIVFARLVVGTLLKWLLVAVVIYLGAVRWRLPPVAMLSGLVLAMLVFPLAHIDDRRKGDT